MKRTIAAFIATVAMVLGTAQPAHAATTMETMSGNHASLALGTAYLYDNYPDIYLTSKGSIWKSSSQSTKCAEIWYNFDTLDHKSPTVYVNCFSGWFTTSTGHIPKSYGHIPPNGKTRFVEYATKKGVTVCLTDPNYFTRVLGQNCTAGEQIDPSDPRPHMMQYNGLSWAALDNPCNTDSDCEYWDVPVLQAGVINNRKTSGTNLSRGSQLVDRNGQYRAVYQLDGNFVVYRIFDGAVLWASGTNGNTSSYMRMQTDGNLVIYNPGEDCVWHSGTYGLGINSFELTGAGSLVGVKPGPVYYALGSNSC